MEQLSLGTKSTRHEIIKKLYLRRYISGTSPIPTATAIAVIDALDNCEVVKPDMTAQLEHDMNAIAEGKKTLDEIVGESRTMLTKVVTSLEKDKEDIKNNITKALKEQNKMGTCPKCGKDMVLRVSRKGKRFIGCSGYPTCDNAYSLPQKGGINASKEQCPVCNAPVVHVKFKGKKLWRLCVNSECPDKKQNNS
jgi:DNA topoisomerase-1